MTRRKTSDNKNIFEKYSADKEIFLNFKNSIINI